MAVANYHWAYGEYPPAYLADEDGTPMHSWRVLVLPFLDDERALYDRYDFSEPWNGPNNRKLANELAHHPFFCPSDGAREPGMTSYVAIVGENTIWTKGSPAHEADVASEIPQTLSIVEVVDSNIHWMEPRDLSAEDALAAARGEARPGLGSRHDSVVNVAFADAHYHAIRNDEITPEHLSKLLTIGDSNQ